MEVSETQEPEGLVGFSWIYVVVEAGIVVAPSQPRLLRPAS